MEYAKVYVGMLVRVSAEGRLTPVAVLWENGREYEVDRVLRVRRIPPERVGGIMTERYDVVMRGRGKTLYREEDSGRWFVETPLTRRS